MDPELVKQMAAMFGIPTDRPLTPEEADLLRRRDMAMMDRAQGYQGPGGMPGAPSVMPMIPGFQPAPLSTWNNTSPELVLPGNPGPAAAMNVRTDPVKHTLGRVGAPDRMKLYADMIQKMMHVHAHKKGH